MAPFTAPCPPLLQIVPTTTRLLLNTRIGLPLLRPLLRSEIGEAAHRRAWHFQGKLTRDVLALYTAPLHCEGWDRALWEVARLSREIGNGELAALLAAAAAVPSLVLVGAEDRLVALPRVESLTQELGPTARLCVLPEVGHLPQEEAPAVLLALLAPFAAEALGAEPSCDGAGGSVWAADVPAAGPESPHSGDRAADMLSSPG